MGGLPPGVEGFMYPNEVELQWGLLIVLYPYLTGLAAPSMTCAAVRMYPFCVS